MASKAMAIDLMFAGIEVDEKYRAFDQAQFASCGCTKEGVSGLKKINVDFENTAIPEEHSENR